MFSTSVALRAMCLPAVLCLSLTGQAMAQELLFDTVGVPETVSLPDHVIAAQPVRINRRALQSSSLLIELFGEEVVALRDRVEQQSAGQFVWVGHLEGNPGNTVIITIRGNSFSGLIQNGSDTYRIGIGPDGRNRLFELSLESLPPDDAGDLPPGGGTESGESSAAVAGDNVVQGLLVVYNDAACSSAGSCSQLEADIVTAVADLNTAYAESGIAITMDLVGMVKTVYTGTTTSAALSAITSTNDGQMDEIHQVRDDLGGDIVAFIYAGEGCGRGYLSSSASTAFSVTDEPCMVGNRTMAHEIGHNQGAHHDRVTAGAGTSSNYNYGYRRCSDGSVDDHGSPYYRTVLSYSCSGAPRVGRFSNPNVNYLGVPQGVDPAINPTKGAWNAKVLNDSASYMAGFRTAPSVTAPDAPSGLNSNASGPDSIDLDWNDNSSDETDFVIQSYTGGGSWTDIVTVGANTTAWTHNDLLPESTHHYRVRAHNSAGDSGYSNEVTETTDSLPSTIDDFASADTPIKGAVSGNYSATLASDGSFQTITETHSGGPKRNRKQSFAHAWEFDVFGGAGGVVASVDAWVSGSEGANFYYSLDGGASTHLMFTINNTTPGDAVTFALPGGASGSVRIQVEDSSQSNGEPVDSVYVDYLVITSHTDVGSPPAQPSGMIIKSFTSDSVTMEFLDNSEDEFGFEIWRAESDPSGNCSAGSAIDAPGSVAGMGIVEYVDSTAESESTYWYWAKSFNGAGDNGLCSNSAEVTTLSGPDITLTIDRVYKIKGTQHVDLSWEGTPVSHVDIVRDGIVVETIPNTSPATHNIGQKGGGSYQFQVCESGSTSACSLPKPVNY